MIKPVSASKNQAAEIHCIMNRTEQWYLLTFGKILVTYEFILLFLI